MPSKRSVSARANKALEEALNPGTHKRRMKLSHGREAVRQKMKEVARRQEIEHPGRRKHLSQAGHLDPKVVESKRIHDDAVRAKKEYEMRQALSPEEFAKWKHVRDKNRRAVVKRTADIRLIRSVFPGATAAKLSQYRRDGTLSSAKLIQELLA